MLRIYTPHTGHDIEAALEEIIIDDLDTSNFDIQPDYEIEDIPF